jgi:hypothetical protein
MKELFEPIGEALVINGVTDYNPEIQLYFSEATILISFLVTLISLISLCYK